MKTLWGAFVIKTPAGNVYFAGDSGYGRHFRDTGQRHGPFKLALMPIGAYEPRWFMRDVHVNPAEAVQAHRDLGAELSIGMHYNTFQLTYEPIDQPAKDLEAALQSAGISPATFITLPPGGSRQLFSATAERQQAADGPQVHDQGSVPILARKNDGRSARDAKFDSIRALNPHRGARRGF